MDKNSYPQIPHSDVIRIAKGAGTVFAGTIIGVILKYLFEVIIANHLGPELFGVFFLGITIFKVLERVSIFGLHNGVLRYVAMFHGTGDENKIKGTILLGIRIVFFTSTILSILIFLFSDSISLRFFNEMRLSSVLKILILGLIFSALTEIFVFATQAFQVMKYKVLVRMVFEPSIRLVFLVFFFILGSKIFGAALAYLISLVSGTALGFYYLNKLFPFIKKIKLHPVYETKRILSFSWPLFFVGFFYVFIVQISTIMLGYFKTAHDVGIFGAAQRTAFLIPIILDSFNSIFAPMIADLYNRGKIDRLEKLFKVVTRWIFSISFLLFLILFFSAESVLSLWGKEYTEGALCLIILCCAQLINCGVGSSGFIIMMTGRTKISLFNTLAVFGMIVGLNFLLTPDYGAVGAALSLGISIGIINIVRIVEVYLLLKIHPYSLDYIRPLVAGGVTLIIMILGKTVTFGIENDLYVSLIKSFIILFTYVLILVKLGINKEDSLILEQVRDKLFNRKGRE